MTREEYEECRLKLGAQLETDIATVRADHAARVRSLESLWHAAKAGDGNAAVPAALPAPPDAPGTTARTRTGARITTASRALLKI